MSIAPPPTPASVPPSTSAPVYTASRVVNPAPYSGSAEECNGFLLQCSLALEMQLHRLPTERAKISFILSLLSGRALQWAESLWQQNGPQPILLTPLLLILEKSLVDLLEIHQGVNNYTTYNKVKAQSKTMHSVSVPLLPRADGMSAP